jgi:hypothetical protein
MEDGVLTYFVGNITTGVTTNPLSWLIADENDVLQYKSGMWTNRTMAELRIDLSLASDYQPLNANLTQISSATFANDDIIQKKSGVLTNRTIVQLKTDLNITKTELGLGNVDNTSDANKPVSTAQGIAIGLKQDSDTDLTAIAGLSPSNDDIIQRKSGAWTNSTMAQLKTDLAMTSTVFSTSSNFALNAGATSYGALDASTISAGETGYTTIIPYSGYLEIFRGRKTSTGGGSTYLTVRVNGSDVAMTVNLASANLIYLYNATTITVSAGDILSVKVVGVNANQGGIQWSVGFVRTY